MKRSPVAADYTISGLSQIFGYGGFSKTSIFGKAILGLMEKLVFWKVRNEPQTVTIRAKPGKSGGAVTIYYEGTDGTAYPKSVAAPSAIGKYAVTFDVAAAADWEAATGLSAGTLEINIPVFTSIAAFRAWLSAQPPNTADTAYTVKLNVNSIRPALITTLNNAANKYVCLDLSGSTFTSIGEYAFEGCKWLTGIIISDSVESIGKEAFSGCYSLASITVDPDNLNYASVDGILYNKTKTEFIHIPPKINGDITIPDSVKSIEEGAFSGCRSLTSVTIPDSVTRVRTPLLPIAL